MLDSDFLQSLRDYLLKRTHIVIDYPATRMFTFNTIAKAARVPADLETACLIQ